MIGTTLYKKHLNESLCHDKLYVSFVIAHDKE